MERRGVFLVLSFLLTLLDPNLALALATTHIPYYRHFYLH